MGKSSKGWREKYLICVTNENLAQLNLATKREFDTIAQAEYYLDKNLYCREDFVIVPIYKYTED